MRNSKQIRNNNNQYSKHFLGKGKGGGFVVSDFDIASYFGIRYSNLKININQDNIILMQDSFNKKQINDSHRS